MSNPIIRREFIFADASFPSCHASTIAETRPGEFVAAWFGGTHESAPDVEIFASRYAGGHWSAPVAIANGRRNGKSFACYNPVLFSVPSGPLLMFYKYGTGPQTWHGAMTESVDRGQTWSSARDLPDGVLGPIKNKPVLVGGRTLLCGSSTEEHGWRLRFESTEDWGRTWSIGPFLNDPTKIGAIQPSILPLKSGGLRAIGRTQQGRLFKIDSADNGKTWGQMSLLDVPNPNSGTDAVRLADGRYVLVYNNTDHGRSPLDVAISTDAEHWQHVLTLETRDGGEFSYPAVIQAADGSVHITYTWERKRIAHVVLDPDKL